MVPIIKRDQKYFEGLNLSVTIEYWENGILNSGDVNMLEKKCDLCAKYSSI